MKVYIFLVFLMLAVTAGLFAQPASTGINTSSPSTKAALHINSSPGSSQGLIIPRLTTAERPAFNPLTNAESGLMFYNTDVDSIFYWTGVRWVSLSINSASSPTNFWNLSGNNADSSLHYLGTGNAQPIIFKTNNIERMRIGRAGNIGLNMSPAGNTLLSLKTPGNGRAFQAIRSTNASPIAEITEKAGGGVMTLYDNAGSPTVLFSSVDDSYIFSHNLGIGVTSSSAKLEVRGVSSIATELAFRLTNSSANTLFYVTNAGNVVIPPFAPTAGVVVSDATGTLSVRPGTPVVGSGIANKVAFWQGPNTLSANTNLHWDNVGGFLGIGTPTPHARLQFSTEITNRKIVLYEGANNDHQYYGFGVNGGTLRYQTDATAADHVFFAATGTAASVELMRIKGSGNVSIGTVNYTANPRLHVFGNTGPGMIEVLRLTGGNCSAGGTDGVILNFQNGCGGATSTSYPEWIGASIGSPYTGLYSGDLTFYTNDGTVTSGPITTLERMRITRTGNVGIGITNPGVKLTVAGNTGQMVHIGNVFSGNYAGITLNGSVSDGSYNFISSSADPQLYINRATGNTIQFRENNVTQLTLAAAGANTARTAHMTLESVNTWGTSMNIYNATSGGSTYSIVSTGAGHPLGAGSFVIQDGFNSNYAFVLAKTIGCRVMGITLSEDQVFKANKFAKKKLRRSFNFI